MPWKPRRASPSAESRAGFQPADRLSAGRTGRSPAALALALALAASPAFSQTPDLAEPSRVLAIIRDYALNYTARLPDFICTQVVERTYYPVAAFRGHPLHDAIEEQITFAGRKETYTVTKINGEPVTHVGHDQLGGIVSSGEFGTLLANTFDPNAGADFHWERAATQKGRRVYIYSFRVPQAKGYGLVDSVHTALAAYKGLLFADPQTGAVLRIEMHCEIPKDSEFKLLELTMEFKPTEVAGREVVLPSHYHLHSIKERPAQTVSKGLVARGGVLSETINEAGYKDYRRFDADSSITFGAETTPKK